VVEYQQVQGRKGGGLQGERRGVLQGQAIADVVQRSPHWGKQGKGRWAKEEGGRGKWKGEQAGLVNAVEAEFLR
jgi:hypothetical protein